MGAVPSPTPEIAVVVPTYQRRDLLPRLLAGLEAQTLDRDRFEVVVVDDGSADGSGAELDRLAAATSLHLRVLHLPGNHGPAFARNRGWEAATAPHLAFTDDDCDIDPGWLAAGLAALQADERLGIVQGRTLLPRDEASIPRTAWTVYRLIEAPTPWFEGCNLFLRRDALEAAGGFDEGIRWFGEDTSLGWAVLAAGWERGFAPEAIVRHDLVERGWRWHARHRYLERNTVGILRRYPAMGEALWRPWAQHPNDALAALAAAGLVLAAWRRPAALLALPYLRRRRPPWGHRRYLALYAERLAVDAAGLAGRAVGSVRHRRLLL